MGRSKEIDEAKVRDKAIRRLERAADLAYTMLLDEKIDAKTRQGWSKRFTDAVRTLNHVVNDREIRELGKRIDLILKYRKKLAGESDSQQSSADQDGQMGSQRPG